MRTLARIALAAVGFLVSLLVIAVGTLAVFSVFILVALATLK